MKKKMSVMVEVDARTLAEFEKYYDVVKFSKAANLDKGQNASADEVIRHFAEVKPEVAVIEMEAITAAALAAAAPELKYIACIRATPANIDLQAAADRGVLVSNAPGRNANAVVEMTLGFIICLARFIPQTHHRIMKRELTVKPGTPVDEKDILWQSPALIYNPYVLYRGIEIEERTLGLIGFGIIGKLLAPKAAALGMKVVTYDPFVGADTIAQFQATKADSLEQLLAEADFVSIHAKPTPENCGMMGWEQFKGMKREAYFINTARGALVDQDALVRALEENIIAGAALDVFDREPLDDESPLLGLNNIILTPHIGGATKDTIRHQSRIVLGNFTAFVAGQELPNRALPKK